MRKPTLALGLLGSLVLANALAQAPGGQHVQIVVGLVDRELNLKPVPKLVLRIDTVPEDPQRAVRVSTNMHGIAEVVLAPGRYKVATPNAVDFQGKEYGWNLEIEVSPALTRVELSNDNAEVSKQALSREDDLREVFQSLQASVVTVWAEVGPGHGTGFLIDGRGLVVTNHHVLSTSEYIAVQVDQARKLPALRLAEDAEKDIAVLWVNFSAVPEVRPAKLFPVDGVPPKEGEKVFTIGSPLNQRKIITTGIVSKVEARAIISDININPGNSGGPLFNSEGLVLGVTTFGDSSRGVGPGVSGIIRIEQALPIVELARQRMSGLSPPPGDFLPVEPVDRFPIEAIRRAAEVEKFKTDPYIFGVGDYDVALITPILRYRHYSGEVRAAKEKEKRTRKSQEAVKGTFRPLESLFGWREYVGDYEPVLIIQAQPKLKETFWSAFGRGLAAAGGAYYAGPARMRFKTDFYRMKLLCGGKEIQPIAPGKLPIVLDTHTAAVQITDATFAGVYKYPADAISSACGQVILQLYSEKDPNLPKSKLLEKKTIEAIVADFSPYLVNRGVAATNAEPQE